MAIISSISRVQMMLFRNHQSLITTPIKHLYTTTGERLPNSSVLLVYNWRLGKLLMVENGGGFQTVRSKVTIKPEPVSPCYRVYKPLKAPPLTHDEYNMAINRPQSPHLTIYKPELTSMLSISHRGTGLALVAYFMAIGFGVIVLPSSISEWIDNVEASGLILYMAKFTLAFPTSYHYINGIRHLSWDLAKNLSLKEIYSTGYIMLATSSAVAIILTLL